MSPSPALPKMVGICGPSGSGKSTLALALRDAIGADRCAVIPMDAYYRDLSEMSAGEREQADFDRPGALDEALLREQLTRISRGQSVEMPVYDFSTHTRRKGCVCLNPPEWVLVEGIFVYCFDWLRPLLAARIFLELEPDGCLRRRIARDVIERGRDEREVRERFDGRVRPSIERWVLPQRAFATRAFDAELPMEELVARSLAEVRCDAINRGAP